MGGKHNKGCCNTNPCGFHCIQNGASPCSTRSARFYSIQFTTDREGTGSDCCNNLWGDEGFWYYKNIEGSGCTWTLQSEPGPGDCDSTIVISGSSATVTVTLGAYTLVWTSADGYDPLCIWPFYYDAEASTPPPDCSWPTQLCVNPYEVCCPDYQFPDTLEAMFEAVLFGCPCSEDAPANKTLTRVPTDVAPSSPYLYTAGAHARWVGVIDVGSCGHSLYVTMECVSDPGLGTRMKVSFAYVDGEPCLPDTSWTTEDDYDASCNPFIFTFELDDANNCCDVPFSHLLKLIIFDPS